jgi:hypothetical protein
VGASGGRRRNLSNQCRSLPATPQEWFIVLVLVRLPHPPSPLHHQLRLGALVSDAVTYGGEFLQHRVGRGLGVVIYMAAVGRRHVISHMAARVGG